MDTDHRLLSLHVHRRTRVCIENEHVAITFTILFCCFFGQWSTQTYFQVYGVYVSVYKYIKAVKSPEAIYFDDFKFNFIFIFCFRILFGSDATPQRSAKARNERKQRKTPAENGKKSFFLIIWEDLQLHLIKKLRLWVHRTQFERIKSSLVSGWQQTQREYSIRSVGMGVRRRRYNVELRSISFYWNLNLCECVFAVRRMQIYSQAVDDGVVVISSLHPIPRWPLFHPTNAFFSYRNWDERVASFDDEFIHIYSH